MVDRYTYVLNAGTTDSHTLPTTHANKHTATNCFTSASVNPTISSTGVSDESSGVSANFFEIRNTSHIDKISGDSPDKIVNRYYPTDKSLTTYVKNKQKTRPNKLRTHKNGTGINVVTGLSPSIELHENDWFILINPDISDVDGTVVSIKPHFARITNIVSYDTYGDGIEFDPPYPSSVELDTKYELYKGPSITDTDVVAVSYGLRGNTAVTGKKYDEASRVSEPTWYFYKDRLVNKKQLDYDTKYNLTTCRWFSDWTSKGAYTNAQSDTQYSSNISLVTSSNFVLGQSVFYKDNSNIYQYMGNVTADASLTITLDYARNTLPSTLTTTHDYLYVGRTIHQTVFRTEKEYGTIIYSHSNNRQRATLVDVNYNNDTINKDSDTGSTYTLDPSKWKSSMKNAHRNTSDRASTHSSYDNAGIAQINANLTGPKRYLHYTNSKLKNNGVTDTITQTLNNTSSKLSKMLDLQINDSTGSQHRKLKLNMPMTISKAIHVSSLGEYELPYTVTRASGTTLTINNLPEEVDYRNDSLIVVDDIIRIGKYHYVVSAIDAPSNKTQTITVNKRKKITEKTFSGVSNDLETFTNAKMYLRTWNGTFKSNTSIDTKVVYDSNTMKRLTIDGNTVSKTSSLTSNMKIIPMENQFLGHEIEIDYGDSNHNFIKIKDATKKFYNPNTIGFMYYLTGTYTVDEEVFDGKIENIKSTLDRTMTFKLVGRDNISKLLNNTVNKNLNHTKDVIYSSLMPMLNTTQITSNGSAASGYDIRLVGLIAVKKYDLLFSSDYELIGEVVSANDVSNSYTDVILKGRTDVVRTNTIYWFKLRDTNLLQSGSKALNTNIKASKHQTDFSNAGNKGVVFSRGQEYTYADDGTITKTSLVGASTTNVSEQTARLGFDLSDIKGISVGNDSQFAFHLTEESALDISYSNPIMPSSSNYFSVVGYSQRQQSGVSLTLAPTFPVVLGSIETNTDTRFDDNCYLYLVNRNISSGGIIHELQDIHADYYLPKQTFRYLDLQESEPGSLTFTYDSIYNTGTTTSKISGSAPAYNIKYNGATRTPDTKSKVLGDTDTNLTYYDNKPIHGSNIIDNEYNHFHKDLSGSYLLGTSTDLVPPKDFVKVTVDNYGTPIREDGTSAYVSGITQNNNISRLINTDPRVKNYSLLALGDIFPESKLRHNHLGYSTDSFESTNMKQLGMLLEADSIKGATSISHQNYTGTTNENILDDRDYDMMNIASTDLTDSNLSSMKRWGIMRLVEATFDWHFNPVDAESMEETDKLPSIGDLKYYRFKQPESIGSTATSSNTIVFNATTTLKQNTSIYSADGDLIAFYSGADITGLNGAYTGTGWTIYKTYTGEAYKIEGDEYTGHHDYPGIMPFHMRRGRESGHYLGEFDYAPLNMTNVFLVQGDISTGDLHYQNLSKGGNPFSPHNIFLPIVSGIYQANAATANRRTYFSAFHSEQQWEPDGLSSWEAGSVPKYYHTSRVIDALSLETHNTSATNNPNKHINFLISDNHIYDNCTAIFKDFKNALQHTDEGGYAFNTDTSAPLGLDTQTKYNDYFNEFSSTTVPSTFEDVDQHSPNLMISRWNRNKALIGTRSKTQLLFNEGGNSEVGIAATTHSSADEADGEAFSTQMFIKPSVNIKDDDTLADEGIVYSNTNKTISFLMNDNSTHTWMSFMPNLTGYYLVSNSLENGGALPSNVEITSTWSSQNADGTDITLSSAARFPDKGTVSITGTVSAWNDSGVYSTVTRSTTFNYTGKTGNTLTGCLDESNLTYSASSVVTLISKNEGGVPSVITKIIKHEVAYESSRAKHTITLDTALGGTFDLEMRLMRISETTFENTPDYIEINSMFDSGLQYNTKTWDFRTGKPSYDASQYNESIYAMYLLLDIDTMNNDSVKTIDRRTIASASQTFTDGENINVYITDGYNTQEKSLTVEKSSDKLRFNYSGNITGNGVVSFGETFNVTSSNLTRIVPRKAYLGTTFDVGTDVEIAIEEILSENNISLNKSDRSRNYTGNIVASLSNTAITLVSNVNANITTGDTIYNQDGKLIGKISSKSGTTVNVSNIFYEPVAGEELVKYVRKPYIDNINFNESNMFHAINYLTSKKGLEYIFNKDVIQILDLDDITGRKTFSLKYGDGSNLLSVGVRQSLFDAANKVIVIGDGVKKIAQSMSTEDVNTITYVNSNIKSETEAQTLADNYLELHTSKNLYKVDLRLEKTGFELMRAGDTINLDFPVHGLEQGDYTVFEIENILGAEMKVTVGRYDKTIAERLATINIDMTQGFANIFTSELENVSASLQREETTHLNELELKYELTETTGGTVLGFT